MTRAPSLRKRRTTLKKKAAELSTLCGIDVAYVCFDPNGRLDTWPEDKNTVKDIVLRYRDVKSKEKPSAAGYSSVSSGSSGGGGEIRKQVVRAPPEASRKSKLDGLSGEELVRMHRLVEEKLEDVRSRIGVLEDNGDTRRKRRRRNPDLPTLNQIDLVGSPPASSETEHMLAGNRCSSSSAADSSNSSMITAITLLDRCNSPISDPKSEWGKILSL